MYSLTPNSRLYLYFDLILPFNQLCGVTFVILSGYFFNTMGYGIKWPSNGNFGGISFHGMFMSTALVYFQGEALLSYRFHRYESKFFSKFLHAIFHLMAVALFTIALVAIIIHKNLSSSSHFTSVHSWIGISVMFVYVVQFGFGFVNFLFSGIAEETKKKFMPIHRTVGTISFAGSIIQTVIGFVEYNGFFGSCPKDHDAPLICGEYKYVLNFAIISLVLFGITTLLLVIPPVWKRQKTLDEMQ